MKPIRRVARGRAAGRLLIVDDEPYWPQFLRETLREQGIELLHENSEKGALAQLEIGEFDLLVISASLPNRGAFALLEALRHRSDIPVVIASGAPDWREGRDAYEAGAVEYLTKSYDAKRVSETFNTLLEWRRSRATRR